jgi:hypothetical protein
MQTGRRAGPPPPAPRGDGPAPKESLRRARARARPQGTVLARRPSVLARAGSRNSGRGPRSGRRGLVFPDAGIAGSTEIRRGTGGAHVEDRGGGALSTSCGGSAGNPEEVNQLVLHRYDSASGGDPVGGRGGPIAGEVTEVSGHPPQPQDHLAGQRGPRQTQDHPAPRCPL